jgi:hypothetical protein
VQVSHSGQCDRRGISPCPLPALNEVDTKLGEAPPLIVTEVGYVQAASGEVTAARSSLDQLKTVRDHPRWSEVEFHPVMSPEDLGRAGLEELGKKWG